MANEYEANALVSILFILISWYMGMLQYLIFFSLFVFVYVKS